MRILPIKSAIVTGAGRGIGHAIAAAPWRAKGLVWRVRVAHRGECRAHRR